MKTRSRPDFRTTKLFLPRTRADRVARPRLVARLGEVLQPGRKVALVCAPAGFGKTSLLADWVGQALAPREAGAELLPATSSRPALRAATWLSLDSSDDDPIRFWMYVLAALGAVRPGIGEALPGALAAPQPPPLDVIIAALVNALATDPLDAAPFALVLDDYHLVRAPAIHEQVRFLVEHLPPSLRLILATRADPPLPLALWRARDELVELRAADLRFSADEAAALLTGIMGLELGPAEIPALATRTEGWVAGLHLAGLAMRDRADLADFVATFAGNHRFVVDFLAEEVFRRQPPSVQAFLLRTSILERMCGPLCDAVLGPGAPGGPPIDEDQGIRPVATGQETLEHLDRANLFTVHLDDERRWYRYHHLFHAVLRERLRVDVPPDEVATLHRRASDWLAAHELVPEAIEHALAAGEFAPAADLIERDGLGMIARGQRSQVLAWLDALPTEVRRARPRLGHLHAVILIQTNRTAAGEAALDEVERGLGSIASDDERRTLRGRVLLSRAVLAWYVGDPAAGARYSEQALELLGENGGRARAGPRAQPGAGFLARRHGDLHGSDARAPGAPARGRRVLRAGAGAPVLAGRTLERTQRPLRHRPRSVAVRAERPCRRGAPGPSRADDPGGADDRRRGGPPHRHARPRPAAPGARRRVGRARRPGRLRRPGPPARVLPGAPRSIGGGTRPVGAAPGRARRGDPLGGIRRPDRGGRRRLPPRGGVSRPGAGADRPRSSRTGARLAATSVAGRRGG